MTIDSGPRDIDFCAEPESPPIGVCDLCHDPIFDECAYQIDFGAGVPKRTGHDDCIESAWMSDSLKGTGAGGQTRVIGGCAAIADGQLPEITRVEPCRDCGLIDPCGCR